MSIYRKDRSEAVLAQSDIGKNETTTVVPKMYAVLLVGILLLMASVLSWAVFGTIDETVTLNGIYHPGARSEGEVIAFAPIAVGKTLAPGMEATVTLVGYETQRMGEMRGKITFVEDGVTSIDEIKEILKEDTLVNVFVQSGPVVLVVFSLEKDADSANGYEWTHSVGENIDISDFTFTGLTVVKDSVKPITLGMSGLAEFFGK